MECRGVMLEIKGMNRGSTYWGHNGHSSGTCPHGGVMLFGVRLMDGVLLGNSGILGNLSHCSASQNQPWTSDHSESETADEYVSDEPVLDMFRSSGERKKGVPWTEDEHRMFLFGLQNLGKGDWRGISRNFVTTRTPTQVASHAQKYFLRQININKRKRRSSLFDIPVDSLPCLMTTEESLHKFSEFYLPPNPELSLGRSPDHMDITRLSSSCVSKGRFPMLVRVSEMPLGTHFALGSFHSVSEQNDGSRGLELNAEDKNFMQTKMPMAISSITSVSEASEASVGTSNPEPFALQLWQRLGCQEIATSVPSSPGSNSEFANTTATAMAGLVGIDESAEMFNLTLGIAPPAEDPCSPSINKPDDPPTHSTFHTSPSIIKTRVNSEENLSRTISVI